VQISNFRTISLLLRSAGLAGLVVLTACDSDLDLKSGTGAGPLPTEAAQPSVPEQNTSRPSDTDTGAPPADPTPASTWEVSPTPTSVGETDAGETDGSGEVLVATVPQNGATNVALDALVTLAFNTTVRRGNGTAVLRSGGLELERLMAESERIRFGDYQVSIDWSTALTPSTAYEVYIERGLLVGAAGTVLGPPEGILVRFSTTAPGALALRGTTPANGSLNVDRTINLVLSFGEQVELGSGRFLLFEKDGANAQVFEVGSPRVTVAASDVTIDPADPLSPGTDYYLLADPGTVITPGGNEFSGIGDPSAFSFQTVDDTPSPVEPPAGPPALELVSTSPSQGASGVTTTPSIEFVFSEPVRVGSGALILTELSSSAVVETAPIGGARAALDRETLTFTPSSVLAGDTTYAVAVPSGGVVGLGGGAFAGLEGASALYFTTRPDPTTCASDETFSPGGYCYHWLQAASSWRAARQSCQARGAGWDLATIQSEAQHQVAVGLLNTETWIGAHSPLSDDTWYWLDQPAPFYASGNPVGSAYVHWKSDEPATGEASCVRLTYDVPSWSWATTPCDYAHAALCQGPAQ